MIGTCSIFSWKIEHPFRTVGDSLVGGLHTVVSGAEKVDDVEA